VVLPDKSRSPQRLEFRLSQCTYRCVVLPDPSIVSTSTPTRCCLNAPTGAWCSLTKRKEPSWLTRRSLNAPTGAWCSLTLCSGRLLPCFSLSQCTYRCVVLPDEEEDMCMCLTCEVSMHLQVRGAP